MYFYRKAMFWVRVMLSHPMLLVRLIVSVSVVCDGIVCLFCVPHIFILVNNLESALLCQDVGLDCLCTSVISGSLSLS